MENLQQNTKMLTDASVKQIVTSKSLSESQKVLIQGIINTRKEKNSKNRRYSENWIILCMLLKIR